MSMRKKLASMSSMTFTSKEWEPLQKGITKVFNIIEGKEPNFTSAEYMKLYTIVYNMCNKEPMPIYSREICKKYKEILEDYIISKVLPSLQEKKDDLFLRELLKRWSDYKSMTRRLSFFSNCQFIRSLAGISVEAVNFSAFNHGVYEKMNKEIMDAIFSVIDRKLAEEMTDQTYVINTLDFYLKFYKCTKKKVSEGQIMNRRKKINLISSDGTVFEIDYGVALMSKRFEDITEFISAGDDVDAICVDKVSSKILTMIVEYCKEGDTKFLEADPKTLLDLTTSACYMKIESLERLTWGKVFELIKGKTAEEIAQIFGDVDDSNSKLLEENVQKIESLEM